MLFTFAMASVLFTCFAAKQDSDSYHWNFNY